MGYKQLVAIKGYGVYGFNSKHDRAMFLHEATNGGKRKLDWAFSTSKTKR